MSRFNLNTRTLLLAASLMAVDAHAQALPGAGSGSFLLDVDSAGAFTPSDFAQNAILPWRNGGIVSIGQNRLPE